MELNISGIRIRMDFSFPALLALAFLCGRGNLLLQTFAVSFLHEAGHGIAMLLTHAGIQEISLTAAGMQMRTKSMFLRRKQELCILLCGPMVNFLMAGILYSVQGWSDAAMLHLCMGCFNLLPFRSLDGGSALECVFAEYPTFLWMQTVFCVILSVGMAAGLACLHIENPFLYLMCLYLGISQLRVDKQGGIW